MRLTKLVLLVTERLLSHPPLALPLHKALLAPPIQPHQPSLLQAIQQPVPTLVNILVKYQ